MSRLIGVIMAAGEGTRMQSARSKMLHTLAGRPLVAHVVQAARAAALDDMVVVIGHQGEAVRQLLGQDLIYVRQDEPRGTGDAVGRAAPHFAADDDVVVVLAGDVPLVPPALIRAAVQACAADGVAGALVTGELADPHGYGRIVRGDDGGVMGIVEEADASEAQRRIQEVFLWPAAFRSGPLRQALAQLTPENAQEEYYLTDAVPLLANHGRLEAVRSPAPERLHGVNRRSHLARLESIFQRQVRQRLMDDGVTLVAPEQVYIEVDVEVGPDTVLAPGTVLRRGTRIGAGCTIGPATEIADCRLGDGCRITHSVLEESDIGARVTIGPFSHIRPNCQLAAGVKVGNFAELKNSHVGQGSKVPHHSYVGDSDVGSGVNVGAGVVTVNYDGVNKYRTVIGDGAFIGCNTNLLAPIQVEAGAYVAAGSTVNQNVPPGALAIARARQENKEGWVKRRQELMEKRRQASGKAGHEEQQGNR